MSLEDMKWSAQNGEITQVRDYMEKGADINATDSVDRQLIHYAADYGKLDIVEMLVNEYNANINAVDKHGNTPLINAAFEGHVPVVKFLVDKGAKKDIKGPNDMTALMAVESADIFEDSRAAIVALLQEK